MVRCLFNGDYRNHALWTQNCENISQRYVSLTSIFTVLQLLYNKLQAPRDQSAKVRASV